MGTITSGGDDNTPASISISDISSSSLCANGTTKLPLSSETCRVGVVMPVHPTTTPTPSKILGKEKLLAGDDICVEGYIMYQFCINLKVLFDNRNVATLKHPGEHIFHCPIDVYQCISSGYEVLIDPAEGQTSNYCGFLFDNAGNNKLLEYAK